MKLPWRKAVVESVCADSFSLSGTAFSDLLTAVLARGIPFRFTARGMSMSPSIQDGDQITISPFAGLRKPKMGDITAVISPVTGKLLVHRIVRLSGDTCQIKGDNAPIPDGNFSTGSILGYVSHQERNHQSIPMQSATGNFLLALFSRIGLFSRIQSVICLLKFQH